MNQARPPRARTLVEVARILVQQRSQNGVADHNVGEAISISSPKALTKTLCTLLVVGSISCLINPCEEDVAGDTDWIGGGSKREFILQLRRKRHGVLVIDNKKVGNNAQNSLLLFCLNLLSSELLDRESDHRRLHH